jgi:alpha-galactosidase
MRKLTGPPAAASGPPFSFTYEGAALTDGLPGWECEHGRLAETDCLTEERLTLTDPQTGLVVRAEVRAYQDFPAVEWTVHLRNSGPADSPILEDIQALDAVLPLLAEQSCVIRYAKGSLCSVDDYAPVERNLPPKGALHLQPGGGRSSSEWLPFLSIDLGERGIILAIGWTGEWAVDLARDEEGRLRLRAGMAHTHLRLHPGEEIRTPRILLLFWEGDRMRGHNLLRRLILKHHRPRPAEGSRVTPLCYGDWGGTPAAVHLENVRRIVAHDLPFETYWIDAEWFGKPGHWMENAGDWEPRADLYPEGFRPISDRLHAAGRKLLLWFEPERVAPGTPWAEEHGEWLLAIPPERAITWADYGPHLSPEEWVRMESHRNQLNAGDRLFDLGHPEAREWLTDFLSAKITEFGLDCLRWDSNIAQLEYWQQADEPDRQGMTEIRYVVGQYALWDELLRRHPHLTIDNCASGGRRIDLESLSRATPLWRTDYAVMTQHSVPMQCHTYGLLFWVPLNGTGGGYLNEMSPYTMRSTMCASWVVGLWGGFDPGRDRVPDDYPFAPARALLEEYLRVREYYEGDYYPLTEYTLAEDAWLAYQLDRPERGDGLVVVLKRPKSPFTKAVFRLRALKPEAEYEVTNLDTSETVRATGGDLTKRGLEVGLPGEPDSALFEYRAH